MKNILKIVFLLLLSGCTTWINVSHTNNDKTKINEIYGKNISDVINVPTYSTQMKSGDKFLIQIQPGLPFSIDLLSFSSLSGEDLYGIPNEIDKAYHFSKLINRLIFVNNNFNDNGSLLIDYYINKINSLPLGTVPHEILDNFPPLSTTSATYNDEFRLTLVNPLPSINDKNSISIDNRFTYLDSVQLGNKHIQVILPSHQFSASINILKIERPWFNLQYALKTSNSVDISSTQLFEGKPAYVEEIILANNIKVENYAQSKSIITISKNGKKIKEISSSPTEKIESKYSIIIGYVYRLL